MRYKEVLYWNSFLKYLSVTIWDPPRGLETLSLWKEAMPNPFIHKKLKNLVRYHVPLTCGAIHTSGHMRRRGRSRRGRSHGLCGQNIHLSELDHWHMLPATKDDSNVVVTRMSNTLQWEHLNLQSAQSIWLPNLWTTRYSDLADLNVAVAYAIHAL